MPDYPHGWTPGRWSHYPDGEPPPLPSWTDYLFPASRAEVRKLIREAVAELWDSDKDIWDYVLEQTEIITKIGEKMSAVDDMVNALNEATDEIASDLAALRDEVAGLDATTAGKFQPLLDRLHALGADPENPVPTPEPQPEPEPEPEPEDGDDEPASE